MTNAMRVVIYIFGFSLPDYLQIESPLPMIVVQPGLKTSNLYSVCTIAISILHATSLTTLIFILCFLFFLLHF
jgi:hypothetical protein